MATTSFGMSLSTHLNGGRNVRLTCLGDVVREAAALANQRGEMLVTPEPGDIITTEGGKMVVSLERVGLPPVVVAYRSGMVEVIS